MFSIDRVLRSVVPSNASTAIYIGAAIVVILLLVAVSIFVYIRIKGTGKQNDVQAEDKSAQSNTVPINSPPAAESVSDSAADGTVITSGGGNVDAPGTAQATTTAAAAAASAAIKNSSSGDVYMTISGVYPDGSLAEMGSFTMVLDWKNAPDTCFKFAKYCSEKGYQGAGFDQVIRDSIIRGGGIDESPNDGSQTRLPTPFEDISPNDNLDTSLHYAGTVAIYNANAQGDNRFFIVTNDGGARNLQSTHGVIARISSGMDTVLKISQVQTDGNYVPTETLIISDCGVITT